jgi:hypothetical protein
MNHASRGGILGLRGSFAMILASCLLLGCSSDTSSAIATKDHEEEHEHAPPHKPENYHRGIDELNQRFAKLLATSAGERTTQLAELTDIARWLPELAADSDMPEADWNVVLDRSNELVGILEAVSRQPRPNFADAVKSATDHWNKSLESLPALPEPVALMGTDGEQLSTDARVIVPMESKGANND